MLEPAGRHHPRRQQEERNTEERIANLEPKLNTNREAGTRKREPWSYVHLEKNLQNALLLRAAAPSGRWKIEPVGNQRLDIDQAVLEGVERLIERDRTASRRA